MKCRYCNTELKQGAKFCPNCGKEVLDFDICINCGKQIKVGASFCPHCGKNQHEDNVESRPSKERIEIDEPSNNANNIGVLDFDICINCEKQIKVGADFCPHCGEKQHEVNVEPEPLNEKVEIDETIKDDTAIEQIQQPESIIEPQEEKLADTVQPYAGNNNSQKWIWILGVILLMGALGGGYYFLNGRDGSLSYVQETDSIAETGDSITSDMQSVEGIKSRLTEILSKALKMHDEDAINTYFSKEYRELFKKVNEYDSKYVHDEPGFWCGNIWDGGQDNEPNKFTIIKVSSSSNINAYAEVKLSCQVEEYHSENIVSMDLVFEDGNWYIDNIGDYKSSMREYLSNSNEKKDIIDAYSKILDDIARKGKNSTNGNFYFLRDINGGGIPELWVQVCNDEITGELLIYEFKDGAISKIYQDGVGHIAHHSFVIVNDCVCLSYGHMGSSSIAEYVYNNGKIQTKEIYSREAYNEEDSDEPKGTEIETYEITDKKPLANI